MDVHVTCPHCNQTIGVRYNSQQTEQPCSKCKRTFSLPTIGDMALKQIISVEKELQSSRKDVRAILLELQDFRKDVVKIVGKIGFLIGFGGLGCLWALNALRSLIEEL